LIYVFSLPASGRKKSPIPAVASFDEVAETAAILLVMKNETSCFLPAIMNAEPELKLKIHPGNKSN